MLKKLIALLLAMVVCASVLAGCGNSTSDNKTTAANKPTNATGTESGETEGSTEDPKAVTFPLSEKVSISMYAPQPNSDYPLTTNVAWKKMEEITNVHFELTSFDSAEMKERLNLLLNETFAGEAFFGRYLDISDCAVVGMNRIKVEFLIGNRNLLGPFHHAGTEDFVSPKLFERFDLADSTKGEFGYRLLYFYLH